MATKRPSFLKRQKEMKRTARALEKREARKERKGGAKPMEDDFSTEQVVEETEIQNGQAPDVEP